MIVVQSESAALEDILLDIDVKFQMHEDGDEAAEEAILADWPELWNQRILQG